MPIGGLILLIEISVLVVIWFATLCWFVTIHQTDDAEPGYSDGYYG